MTLFVKQLKALKTTMSSVAPKHFDMSKWYCQSVGCLCGHQTVFGDLTHFPLVETMLENSLVREQPALEKFSLNIAAVRLSQELCASCSNELGNSRAALSLYCSVIHDRMRHAIRSKLFTEEQLKHPHLNTVSSPQDVVSYIDMILGVL
jgi:hypothetical protein